MNPILQQILTALAGQLPAIAAFIPLPGAVAGAGIISAIAQHLLGDANATPQAVATAITANPAAAVTALKPLDDHLTAVADATTVGASTVPQGALPAATATVAGAVIFATNDAEDMLSPVDKDGGAVLSTYLTAKTLESRRKVYCPAQGKS